MITTDETELTANLADFLRKSFYNIYFEVEINTAALNVTDLASGQKKIRIDLAGWSKLDSSIIFIEAERSLYVKHPLLYSKFADYVYLLCPHASIVNEAPSIKEKQIELLKNNKLGLITLSESSELVERIAPKRQDLNPTIRNAITNKFTIIERETRINNDFIPKNNFPWFSIEKNLGYDAF